VIEGDLRASDGVFRPDRPGPLMNGGVGIEGGTRRKFLEFQLPSRISRYSMFDSSRVSNCSLTKRSGDHHQFCR